MSSNKGKSRQRELARAKYERQLARRAASQRRRRRIWAGIGVLALILVGAGAAWLFGVFDSGGSQSQSGSEESSKSQQETPDKSDGKSGESKDEQDSKESADETSSVESE